MPAEPACRESQTGEQRDEEADEDRRARVRTEVHDETQRDHPASADIARTTTSRGATIGLFINAMSTSGG